MLPLYDGGTNFLSHSVITFRERLLPQLLHHFLQGRFRRADT